ncbi:MAG: tetratricopeptide repeat protein, partial [Thermoanaerobaculia bacterium]|nr:tetratricopeptide repeat protein [Thermoanaerobaculia bacterium]
DPGTSVAGAYGGYLAAMNAVRSRDLAAAEQYLRSSLRADPDYLSAHVLLGMIRWEQRDTAGAEAAFHDALQRDPHFGDAHLGLARLRFWGRWDWSGAEESFLRAIDEAPGRAEVHHAYAWFLLASRRFEEAKASMDRALELDPLAAVLHSDLGWFHYRVRDYPGALTLCHAALEIDPQLRGALDCRHRALARLGQFDLALVHGLELTEIPTELEQDLLSHPADEGYRQFLLYLDSTGAFGGNRFVRAMNLTAAGRDEEALTQLEEAVEERDSLLVLIDVTPEFDPLVSTSRFQEVRRQVKGYERLSP